MQSRLYSQDRESASAAPACDPSASSCPDQDRYGNQFMQQLIGCGPGMTCEGDQGVYVQLADTPLEATECGVDDATHGEVVQDYLSGVCPEGGVEVDPDTGRVHMDEAVCDDPELLAPDHPETCAALCEMVDSEHRWDVALDDDNYPQTFFSAPEEARDGTGTGGTVIAPSPNACRGYGAVSPEGELLEADPDRLLTHELMGHGLLGDRGEHPDPRITPRGQGGHEPIVELENQYGEEQGWPERGTWRDPYCGESFWYDQREHDPDESLDPNQVEWSSFLEHCEDERTEP